MQSKPERRRPSPALIISILALVVAMAGTAIGARHYVIHSTKQISPKVLKKLHGKRGKKGANGAQGVAGTPGPGAKWALVQGSNGAILDQSGGISAVRNAGGLYFVNFGSSLSGKAVLATPEWQSSDLERSAQVARCGGSAVTGLLVGCAIGNDLNHVLVETFQGTVITDENFYVSAISG